MYNKHDCSKTEYQVVLDNKVSASFNTKVKRDAFIAKVNNRTVTSVCDAKYPWNIEDGLHNLKSFQDFAQLTGTSLERVERAAQNGYLQIEHVFGEPHIVDAKDHYKIKGITYVITEQQEEEPLQAVIDRRESLCLDEGGLER